MPETWEPLPLHSRARAQDRQASPRDEGLPLNGETPVGRQPWRRSQRLGDLPYKLFRLLCGMQRAAVRQGVAKAGASLGLSPTWHSARARGRWKTPGSDVTSLPRSLCSRLRTRPAGATLERMPPSPENPGLSSGRWQPLCRAPRGWRGRRWAGRGEPDCCWAELTLRLPVHSPCSPGSPLSQAENSPQTQSCRESGVGAWCLSAWSQPLGVARWPSCPWPTPLPVDLPPAG